MSQFDVKGLCEQTKAASYQLLSVDTAFKNQLLNQIADQLDQSVTVIVQANQLDLDQATKLGISDVMLDRLRLTPERIKAMADSVRELSRLDDPVGNTISETILPNGLVITKRTVPFGVVGMIYESRPNVTVDAACIALKTSNAMVLKGGKEAINTNRCLVRLMHEVLINGGLNPQVIGFIDAIDRETTSVLLSMKGLIDVLIPRGSAELINWVCQNAQVPVIETGAGNCHLFVDQSAQFTMAIDIITNAKLQRPSVCNAVEKVLIHQAIAKEFISLLVDKLGSSVELRADPSAIAYLTMAPSMTSTEYYTEYLDYKLGVIVVEDVTKAITWINHYGTHHSDGIISENQAHAQLFLQLVDSAVVYHNASTRFTDGGEFGLGAEIGIATSKLHARGPMGLEAMTTYKYLVQGNGQIRK